MRGGVLRHFELVDDRPFGDEVVDRAQIGWREAEPVETAAIKFAVLVEEWRDGCDLVVLDRPDLLARGGIEARRPELGGAGCIAIVAMALDGLEPSLPRRLGARSSIGHGPPPVRAKYYETGTAAGRLTFIAPASNVAAA